MAYLPRRRADFGCVPILPSEIAPEQLYLQRRRVLRALGLGALGAALPAAALTPADLAGARKRSPYDTGETLTSYADASSYNNYYEFGTDKESPAELARGFQPRPWTVEVGGECAKPGTLDLDVLLQPHALEERIYRMRCVEAWSMVIPWLGVPLAEVLKRFEPGSKAKYVAFTTLHAPERMPGQQVDVLPWPYREGLRIDEAMHPLALLAVGMYGRVLPNQNGAPLRLVVPWKYGFKGIKAIVRIDFVERQPPTSWNQMAPDEYGFYANVNPKVDHPRWSQASERRLAGSNKLLRPRITTLPFNGYAAQVAELYRGMDLADSY